MAVAGGFRFLGCTYQEPVNILMKLIEWRDKFQLGIPAVDHEHRELINLINEL